MTYRVDRLLRITGASPETTLYDTESEATTEAARLNAAGILAVAWEEPTWVA